MVWTVTLALNAGNSLAFCIDATANSLAWLHIVLYTPASLLIWVSLTAIIAVAHVAANSIDALGIGATWVVETLINLFLALYHWVTIEPCWTGTLCYLADDSATSINAT